MLRSGRVPKIRKSFGDARRFMAAGKEKNRFGCGTICTVVVLVSTRRLT